MQFVVSLPIRHVRWFVAALLLLLWLGRPGIAQASCGGTTLVSDTASLNAAIVASNAVSSGPCIFEIELTEDIILTADLIRIDNPTAGVELVIDGAGHGVDGDSQTYSNFDVAFGSVVSLDAIIITQSFGIFNTGTLSISNSTISDMGSTSISNEGGRLTVANSALYGNGTDDGIRSSGALTVDNSLIAQGHSRGIISSGPITVTNSTISGNGIGIENEGYNGVVLNSTISGNITRGIVNQFGVLTVINSTIADNDAYGNSENVGGIFVGRSGIFNTGTMTVTNSLVANTYGGQDCDNFGTMTVHYSLVETAGLGCEAALTAGSGNIVGADPLLDALQDNGCAVTAGAPGVAGCVPTRALLTGSPALNAGRNDLAVDATGTLLASDQRGAGYPRITDSIVDMGAYEGAVTCSAFDGTNSAIAGTTSALNHAIACYNALTSPDVYTIALANDITLTENLLAVDNATAGMALVIDGDGYRVDGDDRRYNGLIIAVGTVVTVDAMTIAQSSIDGIDVAGTVTVTNSVISGSGDFGVDNHFGTAFVANSTLSDNDESGVFNTGGVMTITNSAITGNGVHGVYNEGTLTVANSDVSGNAGSGVFHAWGMASVDGSIVSQNRNTGIENDDNDARLSVRNSTISGNGRAGIYNTAYDGGGTVNVTNSTISNNTALDGFNGHGISNGGALTVTNSTVYSNTAYGVENFGGGRATVVNSVIAGSGNTDCHVGEGTLAVAFSLVEVADASCGVSAGADGNIVGQYPLLGPLADNGCAVAAGVPGAGACVQTHALSNDSPALDVGNNSLAVDESNIALSTDQRGAGYPRLINSVVDMGAYEGGVSQPPATYTLAVVIEGNGSVVDTQSGQAHTATYQISVAEGTEVTLTASAAAGSVFSGWSGACSGTGPCVVTMTAAQNVTATFTLEAHALGVSRNGPGAGTVTSADGAVACGSTCAAIYDHGTVVTLTASAAEGSVFSGWSGSCSGTGPCTVTMTAAQNVTATFALEAHALGVSRNGPGAGTVTSADGAVACGSTCAAIYDHGTVVTLTASASDGSVFSGWSGACSGTGPCVVIMTAAQNVTATFALGEDTATPVFLPLAWR